MTALEEWIIWSVGTDGPSPRAKMSLKEERTYCTILSKAGCLEGLERLTKSFELLREYDKGI